MKQTISLTLSLLFLFSVFTPFTYAEDGVVTIDSVEDLIRFSNACIHDFICKYASFKTKLNFTAADTVGTKACISYILQDTEVRIRLYGEMN